MPEHIKVYKSVIDYKIYISPEDREQFINCLISINPDIDVEEGLNA